MPAEVVTLRFDVEDRGSRDVERIERRTGALDKRLDQLAARAGAAGAAMKRLAGPASGLANTMGGLADKAVATTAVLSLLTVGLNALPFRAAASGALEFSKAISEVSTLVDGGAAETSALATQIRVLSREYGQNSAAQARAVYQGLSAGAFDAANSVEFLTVANKLAQAGVTDVATSVEGLLAIMKPYGIEADRAAEISDKLFLTVKRGITTIPELAGALGQVTPIASQAGLSIDELLVSIAAITATTKLSTSETATQIQALVASLFQASEKTRQVTAETGIAFDEIFSLKNFRSKGLLGFLAELDEALERTGKKEEVLFKLTGRKEALGAVLTLTGAAAKALADGLDEAGNALGVVDEASAKVRASSAQQFEELKGELADLRIELGQQLLPLVIETSRAILQLIEGSREGLRATGEYVTYYTGQLQKVGALVGALYYGDDTEATNAIFNRSLAEIDKRFDDAVGANDTKRQAEARRAGKEVAEKIAEGLQDGSGDIAQATAAIFAQALDVQNSASAGLADAIQKALDSRELEATIALGADVSGAFDVAAAQIQAEFDKLAFEVSAAGKTKDSAGTTADRSAAFETRRSALFSLEEGLAALAERRAAAESEIGRQVDALTRKREAEIAQLRIAAEGKRGEAALRLDNAPESRVAELQGETEARVGLELLRQLSAEKELAKTEAERSVLQAKISDTLSELSLKRTENLQRVKELRGEESVGQQLILQRIKLESDYASFKRTSAAEEITSRKQIVDIIGEEFRFKRTFIDLAIAELQYQSSITEDVLLRAQYEEQINALIRERADLPAVQAYEEKRRTREEPRNRPKTPEEREADKAKAIQRAWEEVADTISGAATNAVLEFVNGTKTAEQAFKEFALNVLQYIQRLIIELLIAAAIQAALGVPVGGTAGGLADAIFFHDGGPVRKYHSGGLAADEVPAILQTGEYVVSRQGVSAAGLPALHSINRGEAPSLAPEGVARVVAMGAPSRPAPLAPAQGDGGGTGSGFAGGGSSERGSNRGDVWRMAVVSDSDAAQLVRTPSAQREIRRMIREERG